MAWFKVSVAYRIPARRMAFLLMASTSRAGAVNMGIVIHAFVLIMQCENTCYAKLSSLCTSEEEQSQLAS